MFPAPQVRLGPVHPEIGPPEVPARRDHAENPGHQMSAQPGGQQERGLLCVCAGRG